MAAPASADIKKLEGKWVMVSFEQLSRHIVLCIPSSFRASQHHSNAS